MNYDDDEIEVTDAELYEDFEIPESKLTFNEPFTLGSTGEVAGYGGERSEPPSKVERLTNDHESYFSEGYRARIAEFGFTFNEETGAWE